MTGDTNMESENLYLIKISDKKESFYKIGLSVHRYCRFYEIMKHKYDVEIVYMLMGLDCYEAMEAESTLQNIFDEFSYLPKKKFGGYRECFSEIDLIRYKKELNNLITQQPNEIVEGVKITWR